MTLRLRARSEIEQRRRLRERNRAASQSEKAGEGILDFVARANPSWVRPDHLEEYASKLERSLTDRLRVCVSIPPRHGKTETFLHAVSKLLWRMPEAQIGYATYNEALARKKGDRAKTIATRDGHRIDPRWDSKSEWRNREGGALFSAGVGGSWTGTGFNLLFIDDPIKDRVQAESKTYRERAWDWLLDVASTRMQKGGSIFVNMTRWHRDDLVGRCIAQQPDIWTEFNHPAILDEGTEKERSLAPNIWSLEDMKLQRKGMTLYGWSALYLGRPIVRGGALFEGANTFLTLPDVNGAGWITAIGIDLAYSGKTKSDHSAYVVMRTIGRRNSMQPAPRNRR